MKTKTDILQWVKPGRPQSQEDVRTQLVELCSAANKLGLYDAADLLMQRFLLHREPKNV